LPVLAFSSGCFDYLRVLFKAGDEIAQWTIYGGTVYLQDYIKDSGIKFHFVDMNDLKFPVVN
jgi:O-acetylhomoserine/O-acetylserine sulfhydrylase-like pyridoxal-dependent enzyme